MELAYENPSPTQRSEFACGSAYTSAVTFEFDLNPNYRTTRCWDFLPTLDRKIQISNIRAKRIQGFNC